MSTPSLSLYRIETEILELLQFRESVAQDPDILPSEQRATLEQCDLEIAKYVTRELVKADNIAAFLKECERRAEVEAEEINRLQARKQRWEQWGERLKECTILAMGLAGKKEIEGAHYTLKLKKNPPSVHIANADLVPAELQRRTVTLQESVYQVLLNGPMGTLLLGGNAREPEPIKSEIAKALKAGEGVPGCRLKTDTVRLDVS